MALVMLAAPISMRVGWPRQKAFAAATLDTAYKYKIVNENSGLILGISSPSLMAGSTALQWSDNGTADHLWHFIPDGGYYKIENMNSGEVLGVSNASQTAGASVLQWADNGTTDHLWQFTSVGSGYYEILQPLICLFL
jgi:arabinan endo-1,5-alpha-L-arabinosidase